MSTFAIRDERPGDEEAIRRVTVEAFRGHPHSDGSEPEIVGALRADGDLALSLVAEKGGEIVGHVAWSPAILSTGNKGWFVLGPISVVPAQQSQGIGAALIEAGLARLRKSGARGSVVVGDPAYYARFGFVRGAALSVEGPLADYFQTLVLAGPAPRATVSFAPAFNGA